jgi:hypothetical protein
MGRFGRTAGAFWPFHCTKSTACNETGGSGKGATGPAAWGYSPFAIRTPRFIARSCAQRNAMKCNRRREVDAFGTGVGVGLLERQDGAPGQLGQLACRSAIGCVAKTARPVHEAAGTFATDGVSARLAGAATTGGFGSKRAASGAPGAWHEPLGQVGQLVKLKSGKAKYCRGFK